MKPASWRGSSNRTARSSGQDPWRGPNASHASPDPDYLLWLNDDVVLDGDAVARVLRLAHDEPGAVIVGATRDPVSGVVTSGGRRRRGRHPQRFEQLPISDSPQVCDTFNGNFVLVPRAVYELLGGIDGRFAHAYADDDYGMRARHEGVPVLQCPGSVGSCPANVPPLVPRGLRARWAYYQSPKGLPASSQARYLRRHGGALWPFWFFAGLLRRTFAGSLRTGPQAPAVSRKRSAPPARKRST